MIREDKVKVFSGANELNVTNLNVTLGIGKGYNVCSFNGTDLSISKNDKIKVKFNDDVYAFIITYINKSEFDDVKVTAKGFPYILENQSASDETLDYIDSNSLINGERRNIEVVNNLQNIDFKGKSYSKVATPMARIDDMVNVVGGEKYEHNSILFLEELKSIPQMPTIAHTFLDSEVTSYEYSDSTKKESLIKEVVINAYPDIYSENKIIVEFNEKTGIGNVFLNPSYSSDAKSTKIHLEKNITQYLTEEHNIEKYYYFRTKGGIDEIVSCTLDEEILSDYEFITGANIIRFSKKLSGIFKVSYKTKGCRFAISKKTSFSITYKDQTVGGVLELSSTISNSSTSETAKGKNKEVINFVNIESSLYYDADDKALITYSKYGYLTLIFKGENSNYANYSTSSNGINIKTIGCNLNQVITISDITTNESSPIIKKTSGVITFDKDSNSYILKIRGYIHQVLETVKYGGENINYSTFHNDKNGSYISYNSAYKDMQVEVAYTAIVKEVHIPKPLSTELKSLYVVSKVDDNIESDSGYYSYSKDGDEKDKQVTYNTLPSDVKINIPSELNTSLDKVVGKTLTNDTNTYTVDNFGNITVRVTDIGRIILDSSSILAGSKIFIAASCNS